MSEIWGAVEERKHVLSRHRDESILIGDDVVITIVDIRGDKVRLAFEAQILLRCIEKSLQAISGKAATPE